MAKHRFFIAGTDTDAGKTVVTAGLLAKANQQGLSTLGLKPISAGCEVTVDGLRNGDALALQAAASIESSYEQVNPIAYEPPIAPHIAAQQQGDTLSAARIVGLCRGAMMKPADLLLIEGAGGWRVPLNNRETLAMIPQQLNLPVILVVGMKLGCLSHALLTAEAIRRDGLQLAGWVANRVDADMSCYEENVATLKAMLMAPCLGEVPHLENTDAELVAEYLDIATLIKT